MSKRSSEAARSAEGTILRMARVNSSPVSRAVQISCVHENLD